MQVSLISGQGPDLLLLLPPELLRDEIVLRLLLSSDDPFDPPLAPVDRRMHAVVLAVQRTLLARSDGGFSAAVKRRYVERCIGRNEDVHLLNSVHLSESSDWPASLDLVASVALYRSAVATGHPITLQWLTANGTPWDIGIHRLVNHAVGFRGRVDLVQWSRTKNVRLDAHTCEQVAYGAVLGDCLDMLQWLNEKGLLSFGARFYDDIVKNGCWNVMKWMIENRVGDWIPRKFTAEFGRPDQRESLAWLQKRGYVLRRSSVLRIGATA